VRLGLATKQIARELELSPGTVRRHLENIYPSLDVQSRGAAVHVAFGDTDGPFQQVASWAADGRGHEPFASTVRWTHCQWTGGSLRVCSGSNLNASTWARPYLGGERNPL